MPALVDLANTIDRVKQALTARRLQSEAAVRQAVVLPILRALGWDDLDPDRVTPEFELGGRRVDYALSALGGQPSLFIEVKGPGPLVGVEKQLFEYAFHAGIPFAILTNGQEWSFFLPAAPGAYDERLLYKLDLTERQTAEAVERLARYVGFERVRSGDALKDAYKDYDDLHSKRVVRDALPRAWDQLLGEPDELLVDLVAERTASICGFRPSPDLVAEFLAGAKSLTGRQGAGPTKGLGRQAQESSAAAPEPALVVTPSVDHQPRSSVGGPHRYSFLGEVRSARNANEVLLHVIKTLAVRDSSLIERFARKAPARRRNHVARRAEDVYPGRPQLLK
jgi:predicted type IV restriction endonuclease